MVISAAVVSARIKEQMKERGSPEQGPPEQGPPEQGPRSRRASPSVSVKMLPLQGWDRAAQWAPFMFRGQVCLSR